MSGLFFAGAKLTKYAFNAGSDLVAAASRSKAEADALQAAASAKAPAAPRAKTAAELAADKKAAAAAADAEVAAVREAVAAIEAALDHSAASADQISMRSFSRIRQESFGEVYIGQLKYYGSDLIVAVRKLLHTLGGKALKDFSTKLAITGKLRHPNLIQLIGYCFEPEENPRDILLVFDYFNNGTLHDHLFSPSSITQVLSWGNRYKIALGLAKGLQYLHEEDELCAIQSDIKPGNVILDAQFTPQLGNFGLSRFTDLDKSTDKGWVTSYFESNKAKQSDVFSYGIVLLQIATGRKDLVVQELSNFEDRLLKVVDGRLLPTGSYESDVATRLLKVGLACCHEEPTGRPKMEEVISMLGGRSITAAASTYSGENSHGIGSKKAARKFSYNILKDATNGFHKSNMIGSGFGGRVYKGELVNTSVAIKKLIPTNVQQLSNPELHAEINNTCNLEHPNLIQHIGWSSRELERTGELEICIVLEYMPKLSLDKHLFGENLHKRLSWKNRYKIARGLAAGIEYLHAGADEDCVIHRDIKPGNVMLDHDWTPKLGDFGLSRLTDSSMLNTTVMAGTYGYIAREVLEGGKAGKKSDVFSFGIVALDIATGQRPRVQQPLGSMMRLLQWVWTLYSRGCILDAVDSRLGPTEFHESEASCLLEVALWCCNVDPSKRPQMKEVIEVLQDPTSGLDKAKFEVRIQDDNYWDYATPPTSTTSNFHNVKH